MGFVVAFPALMVRIVESVGLDRYNENINFLQRKF